MRKSKAFTLAEVLITLVIIGVIAAMTIPTLMGGTNQQEIKTGFKKAISATNQALSLEYILYGNVYYCDEGDTLEARSYFGSLLANHMSVVEDGIQNMGNGDAYYFKTADGIIYYVSACDRVDLDVNGQKGPNERDVDIIPTVVNWERNNRSLIPSTQYGTDLLYN